MYNDPMVSDAANKAAKKRIDQKAQELTKKVADETSTDTDFTQNIFDLCQVNKMAESYY